MPARVVALRPLVLEERLSGPVPALLPPEGRNTRPAMVPDDRAGAEPQRPSSFLQPPADVHVVAGRTEPRVEPTDRNERVAPEGHVAAGDVLGLPVRQHDVDG